MITLQWFWCETCNCPAVRCHYCENTSCNGSGCEECDEMFTLATKTINENKAPTKEEIDPDKLYWIWNITLNQPVVMCGYCNNLSCGKVSCHRCQHMFEKAKRIIDAGQAPTKEEILYGQTT